MATTCTITFEMQLYVNAIVWDVTNEWKIHVHICSQKYLKYMYTYTCRCIPVALAELTKHCCTVHSSHNVFLIVFAEINNVRLISMLQRVRRKYFGVFNFLCLWNTVNIFIYENFWIYFTCNTRLISYFCSIKFVVQCQILPHKDGSW